MALLRPTRRELLLVGLAGSGALAVGVYGGYRLGGRAERRRRIVPPRDQAFAPSPFVAIDEQGEVVLWLTKAELGQGVSTSLPMLVADELGADPQKMRVVLAPAHESYGSQFTAVSSSVKSLFLELRRAGAAAREMLVAAAAEGFGVPTGECRAESGSVLHPPSGRRLPFGALVLAAARLPVPQAPTLKTPGEWTWIGRGLPRLDAPAKVDGSAVFGVDVRLPGMLFAVLARCPVPGGRIVGFDAEAAERVPGVRGVLEIEGAVAVLGGTTHAALRGREALRPTYELGPGAEWSSARIEASMGELIEGDGRSARREGRGREGLEGPGRKVAARYRLPFLAHATMEPMNCTADVRADGCTLHVPTQSPVGARNEAARILGLDPSRVVVHPTFAGGGFGRRVAQDFVAEAVRVSQRAGRPVQVLWTREDDFAHDQYRPCSLHHLEARLSEDGRPLAWRHRIAAPSILAQDPRFTEPVDPVAVEGARELPYAIPDLEVEFTPVPAPTRLGFWRSVGHSYNAFAVECFLDELAVAGGRDPVELRLRMLEAEGGAAHRRVLELAVAAAGEAPEGAGRGRGVAVHASFGSVVAMVADVTASAGSLRVDRVVAAVDCGFAVHPDGVVAQVEGGVAFALTAALYGRMTFEQGAAVQSNFHDQPLLSLAEMPRVDVHLVTPAVPPDELGGVGEIAVPPLAPAVANAIFRATGKRLRDLPFDLG